MAKQATVAAKQGKRGGFQPGTKGATHATPKLAPHSGAAKGGGTSKTARVAPPRGPGGTPRG